MIAMPAAALAAVPECIEVDVESLAELLRNNGMNMAGNKDGR